MGRLGTCRFHIFYIMSALVTLKAFKSEMTCVNCFSRGLLIKTAEG